MEANQPNANQIDCKGFGRPSRQHCPAKWPDYPCYTRRRTCVNTDGVELFEPFGEIIGVGTHAINDFITGLKALIRGTNAESIRQDPQFYTELYSTLNSYVPQFTNRNPIEQHLEPLREAPIDSYLNRAQDSIESVRARWQQPNNPPRPYNFNQSRRASKRSRRRASKRSRRQSCKQSRRRASKRSRRQSCKRSRKRSRRSRKRS